MNRADKWEEERREAAAAWVIRLDTAYTEKHWEAFRAWLASSPENGPAFDEAMTVWSQLDARAPEIGLALAEGAPRSPQAWPARAVRSPFSWRLTVASAVAMAAITAIWVQHWVGEPPSVTYASDKGQRRSILLEDGTKIELNSGSRIVVRQGRHSRQVTLEKGSEAAFIVTHDERRPFTVRAGDRILQDIGTEFDVRRWNGRLDVTVKEGRIEVLAPAGVGIDAVSLGVGDRLEHQEGTRISTVSSTFADDAFDWIKGRAIFRDQPLSVVVSDLNHYLRRPLRVEGKAADLHFSGALAIDDDAAMGTRIAAIFDLAAREESGVMVLRSRNPSRPANDTGAP